VASDGKTKSGETVASGEKGKSRSLTSFGMTHEADEPLAIRKRYGVTEEISLPFLRAR